MVQLALAWLAAAAFAASLGFFLHSYLVLFGPAAVATEGPAGTPSAVLGGWLFNLGLFTAFALHHSIFARTRAKDLVRRLVPPPLERAVYTLIASLLFALVCWLWRPVPGDAWTLEGPWRWVGFGAQIAGVVLTIIGARALDVLELAGVRQVMPAPPLPAESRQRFHGAELKTDGLYGFVRHPLYFAWLLLVFGAPDMTMTRLSFAVISTLYLAAAIPFEERGLAETFGPAYASYRTKVRWRMIPGIW